MASLFYQNKDAISAYFSQTQNATFDYYKPIVEGCKKVLVVDLGWNGTCGIALKYLLEEKKKLDITVCSALVGAKDGQEPTVRMANGDLFVYGFARNMNYDLQKNHMGKDVDYHNLLMEILFTAPEPSFLKFGYCKNTVVSLYSGKQITPDIILSIQMGVVNFCRQFLLETDLLQYTLEGRISLIPIQSNWNQKDKLINIIEKCFINTLPSLDDLD